MSINGNVERTFLILLAAQGKTCKGVESIGAYVYVITLDSVWYLASVDSNLVEYQFRYFLIRFRKRNYFDRVRTISIVHVDLYARACDVNPVGCQGSLGFVG